jgi:hypothetical protein
MDFFICFCVKCSFLKSVQAFLGTSSIIHILWNALDLLQIKWICAKQYLVSIFLGYEIINHSSYLHSDTPETTAHNGPTDCYEL